MTYRLPHLPGLAWVKGISTSHIDRNTYTGTST